MPRTKVNRNTKRNRETAQNDEKIRLFESFVGGYRTAFEDKHKDIILEMESEIKTFRERTDKNILHMKMKDFVNMINKIKSTKHSGKGAESLKSQLPEIRIIPPPTAQLSRATNPNDEGYITEDSIGTGSQKRDMAYTNTSILRTNSTTITTTTTRLRTPGPLNSTVRKPRRSRSACSGYSTASLSIGETLAANNVTSSSTNANVKGRSQMLQGSHASRSKLRTPMSARGKAISADRTMKDAFVESARSTSPMSAVMRWPKPGELVLSMYGSPLMAQVIPDKCANVNIPLRNGVISLRPKKLDEVQRNILDAIDPDTLNQLKTLHANLDKIVSLVDKSGLK